jgi:hypothetical protein
VGALRQIPRQCDSGSSRGHPHPRPLPGARRPLAGKGRCSPPIQPISCSRVREDDTGFGIIAYAAGAGVAICCIRWKRSTCCAVDGRSRS